MPGLRRDDGLSRPVHGRAPVRKCYLALDRVTRRYASTTLPARVRDPQHTRSVASHIAPLACGGCALSALGGNARRLSHPLPHRRLLENNLRQRASTRAHAHVDDVACVCLTWRSCVSAQVLPVRLSSLSSPCPCSRRLRRHMLRACRVPLELLCRSQRLQSACVMRGPQLAPPARAVPACRGHAASRPFTTAAALSDLTSVSPTALNSLPALSAATAAPPPVHEVQAPAQAGFLDTTVTFEQLGAGEELCHAVAERGFDHPASTQVRSVQAPLCRCAISPLCAASLLAAALQTHAHAHALHDAQRNAASPAAGAGDAGHPCRAQRHPRRRNRQRQDARLLAPHHSEPARARRTAASGAP